MKRSTVFGLVFVAALATFTLPARGTEKTVTRRPTTFAVGTTTVHFDNRGRTVTATIYYPAKGRATPLEVEGAPRATKWAPYPLILFSHEYGATAETYSALLHRWAEKGYVVAVPVYPSPSTDEAEPGDLVVDVGERVDDASFVMDRMLDEVQGGFGRLVDRGRVAAAGHALGAVTTYVLAFSSEGRDTRIDAAVMLSGGLAGDASGYFDGVDTPLLAIHGDADETDPIEGTSEAYGLAHPPKFFVTLLGGDHTAPFVSTGDPAMKVVEETTLDFFSAYLEGHASGLQQLLRDGKVKGLATIKSALPD
jgi:fermentation-respiration switch protein FrsA (DUF1100 family)